MTKLAIVGAGGHGKIAAEIASKTGWTIIEFFDARWPKLKKIGIWDVVGNEESLCKHLTQYDALHIAIGENQTRLEKVTSYIGREIELANLVAPSAMLSPNAKIGKNVLIAECACVNIDVSLGNAVIINSGATVDHDCKIDAGAHICPGVNLAGNVSIGTKSFIGIGSSVIQGISVAENVILGAGSALIKNAPNNSILVGVPAQLLNNDK